jgi:hypothetical protein
MDTPLETRNLAAHASRHARARAWLSLGALLISCNRPIASDDAATPRHKPQDTTRAPEPAARETLQAELVRHMHDHLDVAGQARDAIVEGNLALAQGPLIWLGQHGYYGEAPAAYMPYLTTQQEAARRAGDAASLEVAASAVAAMAAACGGCHSAISPRPVFASHALSSAAAPGASQPAGHELKARMHIHAQASARLWDGLIMPSDTAWKEGAMLLGEVAFGAGLSRSMQPALRQMGELGVRAGATDAAGDARAQLYGQIIARCGACHVRLAVKPGRPLEHHPK